ncbi:MAG: hypothetical protein JNM56_21245 [Planctomycetia bacterium]|nr:hypothetical protein [Planctomycetia bacterium]
MPMLSLVVDEGKMSQLERTAGQVGVSVEELLRLSLDEFVARRVNSVRVGRGSPQLGGPASIRSGTLNARAVRDN